MSEIGRRIRRRRMELEITVDEMARRLGKNRATVYRYENGDIEDFSTSVLADIAEILHTTPADLMGYTNEPATPSDQGQALIAAYRSLNNEGKQALNDYVEYLQSMPKFTSTTKSKEA